MNVGLDPVQNFSKSGLKPDYDDLGIQNRIKSEIQIKLYDRILIEILEILVEILVEILIEE